jgi:hypothetical protein
MANRKFKPYRLRVLLPLALGATVPASRYITRDARGIVSYFDGEEKAMGLAELLGTNAAEARFALTDAVDGNDAMKKLRPMLTRPGVDLKVL